MSSSSFSSPIQWYPGHIAKYERELADTLKLVDVVVEVLDARIPMATLNRRLEKRIRTRPVVLVLNKADLADPTESRRWKQQFEKDYSKVLFYDCTTGKQKQALVDSVLAMGEETFRKLESKGLKRRPLRVMVAGMPNVGKSSIINSVVGKKKARTGHKAGVTRQGQWVRIHPQIELLDSPGIIPPSLDSEGTGYLLATVSSVGEAAFEEEKTARFLMETLEGLYPGLLRKHFNLPEDSPLTLAALAEVRHYVLGGGEPDERRMAQALLVEFRQGRLGRLSLEHIER